MTQHIAPQQLARLAEGRLPRQEMPDVLEHLDVCVDCTEQLEMANEVLAEEAKRNVRPPQPWKWWTTLAAAALLAVVSIVAFYGVRRNDGGIAQLVALAPHGERLVEPRLSGGFAWAEYRGPDRASRSDAGIDTDAATMKLVGAAGEAKERATRDQSAEAQHTAGVALLLVDRSDEAMRTLRLATDRAPNDPAAWSDLAAAQYAAAVRLRRSSLFPEALASADRALRLDAKHAEALFNRALILHRMGLREEARAAWQAYLAVDASSPWANEARRYLNEIPAVDQDAQFQRELPRLERAEGVRELVAAYPQQARTWGEGVYLGAWAEGNGDAKQLEIARSIAVVLRERGETLLSEAVAAIDRANAAQRASLIAGHAAYKRGRMLYARQKPTEAGAVLLDAAQALEAGGSPMALLARYFAANTLYDRQQIDEARRRLTELRGEGRRYAALTAQVEWQLAMCEIAASRWAGALPLARSAEETFLRGGELRNAGAMAALVAGPLAIMGRVDDAWDARIRSFSVLSAAGNRQRLLVGLGSAMRMELRLRHLDAARALAQLETSMGRSGGNDLILIDALVRHVLITEQVGDRDAARRLADEAAAAAARMADPSMRARVESEVAFARGAALLASDPLGARDHLTRAIDGYIAGQITVSLPESYLLRARASARLGDVKSAMRDLDLGIAEVEREPIRFAGTVVGTGVLDAGRTLYEDAIRLRLDAHDEEGAFALAERARAQLATTAAKIPSRDELRQRLAGSGAAVLELFALPDEVVAFLITERELLATRTRTDRAALATLDARALFDVLVRPSLAGIGDAATLIVVADTALRNVPFAALTDGSAPLIERLAVVTAPNAASLQREETPASTASLLAVALPTDATNATLPDAEREIAELSGLYDSATVLAAERATFRAFAEAAPRAGVVHVSGHTAREVAESDRTFVFANGEAVSWQTVAATPVGRNNVVVLAACETLRASASNQERALSLGEAFLAAGARGVFGTLTPIADRDARALFVALHRQLASGARLPVALRRVQLEAVARREGQAWPSVVLITNRIPTR